MAKKIPRATVVSESALGVQEASGLVEISDETFLVVDDEHGIFRCQLGSSPAPLEAGKGMADLEGICASADGRTVFVLAERDGSVWRFSLDSGDLKDGQRLGTLPRLNNKKNQGWEGIACREGEIVAAHQRKPASVGFFDAETLEPRLIAKLPKDARRALSELNDLAVSADGERLYLVGGRAGCIATLAIRNDKLETEALHSVASSKHDVPEGLCVASDGELWLCTDGEGMLRNIRLS